MCIFLVSNSILLFYCADILQGICTRQFPVTQEDIPNSCKGGQTVLAYMVKTAFTFEQNQDFSLKKKERRINVIYGVAFQQLKYVRGSRNLTLYIKVIVKPVVHYESKTWRTSFTKMKKVQTYINTCLRIILQILWLDKIRNEELWQCAKQHAEKQNPLKMLRMARSCSLQACI